MTTKSFVGRIERDGRFVAHSVTYDGYPAGVGASLVQVLMSDWAQGRPARVFGEMVLFRHWWSIGLGLDGPTRVGRPNERPEEQGVPLVTGRLGGVLDNRPGEGWGYPFRGEEELVVVKVGQWWQTPLYRVQEWLVIDVVIDVASIILVDGARPTRALGTLDPGTGRPLW